MSTEMYDCTFYYWYWGLISCDLDFTFNLWADVLISGISIGLLILITGINLVLLANRVRKGVKTIDEEMNKWISFSVLAITGAILWIMYTALFGEGNFIDYGYNVWDHYSLGFGLIGAFVGGSLSIVGIILLKVLKEKKISDI